MPVSKERQVELRAMAAERNGAPYLVKQKNKHIIDKMRENTEEISRKVEHDGDETRNRLDAARSDILQAIVANSGASSSSSSANNDKLELYARIMQLKVADIKELLRTKGLVPRGTKVILARIAAENLTDKDVRDFETKQTRALAAEAQLDRSLDKDKDDF